MEFEIVPLAAYSSCSGWRVGVGFVVVHTHVDLSFLGLVPRCSHGACSTWLLCCIWHAMAMQGCVSLCNVLQGPISYPFRRAPLGVTPCRDACRVVQGLTGLCMASHGCASSLSFPHPLLQSSLMCPLL